MIRKIFRAILWLIFLVFILFASFLAFQTVNEFNPPKEIEFPVERPDTIDDSFTIISWNIGYFGLGAEMDFFYEGGTMVRPSKEQYELYRHLALQRISTFDTAEFILLQEVDTMSHRSYKDNQFKDIIRILPGYEGFFAMNYKAWVPVPPSSPMGKVRAGQITLSRYNPQYAARMAFESSYDWPMRLFQLKRCYLETRFITRSGKELVLINTHNSAFDDAASLREKELNTLKQLMIEEYKKGNYVLIGGDWNQNPPPYDTADLLPVYKSKYISPGIPSDFIPTGWNYAYDPLHTTNRDVNTPYSEGSTITNLIDFFVLSPNIKLEKVQTIPTAYRESDHQPVVLKVTLQ